MAGMDHLFTQVVVQEAKSKISFRDHVFFAGSCFSEHIADRMERSKYKVCSNPFGILYNPVSLATSLQRISKQQLYTESELVLHDGLYHSMDHHGSYSAPVAKEALSNINEDIIKAHAHLDKSAFAMISLGSALVYTFLETGVIAGNCHKIPQTRFETKMLSVGEVVKSMEDIHQSLSSISPSIHIVWTVSPVRHLAQGAVENQRSKATLILAVHQFTTKHPESNYFPAYEIMLDQLRDYRFYASDMLHPSDTAVDIIWRAFSQVYAKPDEQIHHAAIERIQRAMDHRFLHPGNEAIRSFARTQLRNIQQLAEQFPEMDWKKEKQYFFHLIEPD